MKDPETKTPETNNNEAAPRQEAAPEAPKAKEHKESRSEKRRLEALEEKIKKLEDERAQQDERYKRLLAEYDNFRKRSKAEREGVYADACADVIGALLPVYDNIERAAAYTDADAEKLAEGIRLTVKSFDEALKKLGVTEIEAKTFDPSLHNAVMHVEDENLGENTVAEVFQAGFQLGEKVIRFAMVKVAN